MTIRFGVDLGGTKIESIAMAADGRILMRQRVPTPAEDYPGILAAITGLVQAMEQELGATGTVGVATPGALSPSSGRIKNSNSQCLNGRPLGADLADCLGRRVRLANDADCLTLSEAIDGAAMGAAIVFGVIVGTGTGGGIVANGKLLVGPNAITGEWGHNPLPWPRDDELPGPPCYCGKHGCIETFLSGPAMTRDHQRQSNVINSAEKIAGAAAAGNTAAAATLARYVDRMARALASVINILDPEVIVLGGGLSRIDCLYDLVPGRWEEFVFSDHVITRLVPARHGDSSGVRGAAWLWPLEDR